MRAINIKILLLSCLVILHTSHVSSEGGPAVRFGFSDGAALNTVKGGEYEGIDIEILRLISEQLGWKIEVQECPWKRCMSLLRQGKIDLLSNAAKLTGRNDYLYYVEPPSATGDDVVFYIMKGKDIKLESYTDLLKLNVGIIFGSVNFEPFDSDGELKKFEVGSTLQLYRMLLGGRIDTFPGHEIMSDYDLAQRDYWGSFEKANYRVEGDDGYFIFSRKSPLAKDRFKFGEVLKQLIESGKVREIELRHRK